MRIQIATRHCDVPEPIRRRAEGRIEKLVRYQPRLNAADLTFSEERHLRRVEGVLSVDGESPVVARGEGTEFRAALEQMLDRLQRMLREQRDRHTEHRAEKLASD